METGALFVVVPARGGSKRLPGKNLRVLGGRTLLERTADALRQAGLSVPCFLSTDDERIAEAGRALGWLVPLLRPTALAQDDTPTTPVIRHAVDWYREARGHDPDITMVLQVTSPFRTGETIRRGLTLLTECENTQAVVAMSRIDRAPRHLFGLDADRYATPWAESDFPKPIYTPNGALYLIRTAVLRETGSLFPPRTAALITDPIEAIDLDDEADWRLAEAVAAWKNVE